MTIFHDTRPLVRWSNVENFRDSMNGDSYVVDAVTQNDKDSVTAAMAEIGSLSSALALLPLAHADYTYDGSDTGNWAAPANTGLKLRGPS